MITNPDVLRAARARASKSMPHRSALRSLSALLATCLGGVAALALFSSSASAQVAYDETISGDLSNSGLAPTKITLNAGSNQILGTTGRRTGVDRDYFTVTVPSHFTLKSIIELPSTSVGGLSSFIGLQAGNQVTLPTNAQTAAGLLGWTHYGAGASLDILPLMALPSNGSSGFSIPLSEGTYSFWIQDFDAGSFAYGFDLQVVAAVPEPSTYSLIGGALVMVIAARRRFGQKATTSTSA